MVKVKVISRSEEEFTRERSKDHYKVFKNLDPSEHPFEKAREYKRAVNATKLERLFAKPFLSSLSGHRDGVYTLARHPKSLTTLVSGACDGEIRVWNLALGTCIWSTEAHNGFVRGLSVLSDGDSVLSCGDDKSVKLWSLDCMSKDLLKKTLGNGAGKEEEDDYEDMETDVPKSKLLNTWLGDNSFTAIDHQRLTSHFATSASNRVDIWDVERNAPIAEHTWGHDSVMTLKFNPIETHLLASTATDRSIALYDLRGETPIRRVFLTMKSNAISWNPMEAFNFTVANEDHNLYTFDMRHLDKALMVHKDHVSAVLDVDYSPTGKEFVSGSYDRTLRIFRANEPHSREVYHTKRMQRIFTTKFTGDSRYVLSGSDDTNIRLWKAQASEAIKPLISNERSAVEYGKKLKQRYKNVREVSRIDKQRHLPRPVFKAKKLKQVMEQSERRKRENVIKHSKPGSIKKKTLKEKNIIEEQE